MDFPFDALRRWPDVEAPDLVAVDAADRLLLDVSHEARRDAAPDDVVVIGDAFGALTLASAQPGWSLRVHQDSLLGERALVANAEALEMSGVFRSLPLSAELVRDARVVLLRLPRSLDALDDIAGLIARHAGPDVRVFAGGRIKHMTLAMNDVLRRYFGRVDVSPARQKSRVLIAAEPHDGRDPEPKRARVGDLEVCAFGGVFAGASLDIGTRFLLENLPNEIPDDALVVDLACGNGVVGVTIARRHPRLRVHASDVSAAAVASARVTAAANGVADRVEVVQDAGLSSLPDGVADLIALNPPFHTGAAVHERLAHGLFADAARVLAPGGELWTVWNSHLRHRSALDRLVGPTRQVARNAKFTVTVSRSD
ncbi:16S rRNA (guanine1207-N2)-methyltransferase [Microbacterium sp. SLBN-154]|uniref:class I SAM-dependent methyltransferase n=1 Tax=Microbacterium sp. SLBN-154 TaxID=2768458 RepID=UPI00114F3E4A|nr:methyltransferase [Microbacterium sp. SLBN-154]TQK20092.1 16S rRNA (guanine1207-N2)-methyltransferase [Microbacterium sp. SLBN-154]